MADLEELQSETNSALTSVIESLADEKNLSSSVVVDNHNVDSLSDGPTGNRTPETLMLKQRSSQTRPITSLFYHNQDYQSIMEVPYRVRDPVRDGALIKSDRVRDPVRDQVRDLVRDPVRDQVRDPVRYTFNRNALTI